MWPILAALLLVWNFSTAPLSVVLDGQIQCVILPHEACTVSDIPAGKHTLYTGQGAHYDPLGKVPAIRELTFSQHGWYKLCRWPGYLEPDACQRWIQDSNVTYPPGVKSNTVQYHPAP